MEVGKIIQVLKNLDNIKWKLQKKNDSKQHINKQ